MLVRIKPYQPRKGLKLRTFVVSGNKFEVGNWYEVDDTLAAYLKTVRNDPENSESPLAFDVCTVAEAKSLAEAEKRAARLAAEPDDPVRMVSQARRVHAPTREDVGTLTTRDLPGNKAASEGEDASLDALPGDEDDLESEDLAEDVAAEAPPAPKLPGAPPAKRRGRPPKAKSGA